MIGRVGKLEWSKRGTYNVSIKQFFFKMKVLKRIFKRAEGAQIKKKTL